jgi:ArsR family transcriptional regulator
MKTNLQQEINQLHAEICQGLADPTRIFLLYTLDEGPQRVTDIAEALGLPQSTVSHHLKVLRERGLVTAEREGTAAYYSLADRRVIEALDILRQVLADRLARRAELMGDM